MRIEKVGKSLAAFGREQRIYLNHHFAPLKFEGKWLPFYMAIAQNSGLSQNELSELLDCDKTITAKVLKKLELAGYIERKRGRVDTRCKELTLTKKGEKIFPKISKVLEGLDKLLSGTYSQEEIQLFISMLDTFSSSIKKSLKKE